MHGRKGWGNLELEKTNEKLNLTDYVRLTGYVYEPILATLYTNALFLAMPSLYEGFGLPIIEANSFGLPGLRSNSSSMPEVAGLAAIFVNPLDVYFISSGLNTLLKNPDIRESLSIKSRKNAAQFSWENSAKKNIGYFQKNHWKKQSSAI